MFAIILAFVNSTSNVGFGGCVKMIVPFIY